MLDLIYSRDDALQHSMISRHCMREFMLVFGGEGFYTDFQENLP